MHGAWRPGEVRHWMGVQAGCAASSYEKRAIARMSGEAPLLTQPEEHGYCEEKQQHEDQEGERAHELVRFW